MIFDPQFIGKTRYEVCDDFIIRELQKNGVDINEKSLWRVEKRRLIATLISALFNFIIIALFWVFHGRMVWTLPFIGVSLYYWHKYYKENFIELLELEVCISNDEKISDVVASEIYDLCSNLKRRLLLIMCFFTFVLPVALFFSPHVIYEDASDGKFVSCYLEGLVDDGILEIPETVDGKTVKGIRGYAFSSSSLVKVTLPNTIDSICRHAFEDCEMLTSINLPTSLKYLGEYAFSGCLKLEHVDFPSSLRNIGGYAFYQCRAMTINDLPCQLDSIGAYAFYRCRNIKNITLPEKLSEIHAYCFASTRVSGVEIPATVQSIGESAFCNTKLSELTFAEPSQLQRIGSSAFRNTQIEKVIVPQTVTEIGDSAFMYSNMLMAARIPKDCEVAEKAFGNTPAEIELY